MGCRYHSKAGHTQGSLVFGDGSHRAGIEEGLLSGLLLVSQEPEEQFCGAGPQTPEERC